MNQSSSTWLAAIAAVTVALAGNVGAAEQGPAVKPSAVLKQVEGRIVVGQGQVRKLGRKEMPLYAGSRVIASAKAKARLVYPDGCVVNLPENSLLVIGAPDQCSAGLAKVTDVAGFQDKAIGQITEAAVGSSWYTAAQTAIANQLLATGVLGAGATTATAMAAAATVMAVAGVSLAVVAGTAAVVGITEAAGRTDNSAEVQAYLTALAQSREPITVTPPPNEPIPTPAPISS